ncbi:LCP family protein [Curtobacterium flaccumfaciens]|nr:LCP family protein [Curtobacterium flaccumfaciens]
MAKTVSAVVAVALVSSVSVTAIAAKQVTDDLGDGVEIQGQPAPQAKGGPKPLSAFKGGFNMLVVGTDNDPDQSAAFGERDATLNDVNILLHVSADHTNATAVSIPRDLVTPIPACKKTDGTGTAPAMAAQPINTSFGEGGLNCVTQTVAGLTGLDIQYSAAVSFKGVIEMSNAIGGVPVCVAQPITDSYTGLNLPAGTSTLQGDDALAFLRTRHSVGDGSDLARISSQQVFLSSLLRTVKSNDTLSSARPPVQAGPGGGVEHAAVPEPERHRDDGADGSGAPRPAAGAGELRAVPGHHGRHRGLRRQGPADDVPGRPAVREDQGRPVVLARGRTARASGPRRTRRRRVRRSRPLHRRLRRLRRSRRRPRPRQHRRRLRPAPPRRRPRPSTDSRASQPTSRPAPRRSGTEARGGPSPAPSLGRADSLRPSTPVDCPRGRVSAR